MMMYAINDICNKLRALNNNRSVDIKKKITLREMTLYSIKNLSLSEVGATCTTLNLKNINSSFLVFVDYKGCPWCDKIHCIYACHSLYSFQDRVAHLRY